MKIIELKIEFSDKNKQAQKGYLQKILSKQQNINLKTIH